MTAASRIAVIAMLAASLVTHGLGVKTEEKIPADEEIRKILADRIDKYRQSVGIVVGMIGPEGRQVVAYGRLAANDSRPLNGDTIFEIGSITKVFTSLLLADMVEHGEVTLADPVSRYLPRNVVMPDRRGQKITLEDLAMHMSGLPRMPTNLNPENLSNPFADYSLDRLYEYISSYRIEKETAPFEYSNLGGALLGQALARRAGMAYEPLVSMRITQPLRMQSTSISLTPEMKSNLAVGHAYGLEPLPNWDFGAFVAAGALRSSTNDLLTFLSANLGYTRTPLASAMATMLKTRRVLGDGQIALAWFVEKPDEREIVFHSGATGGYRSFIGYDTKSRIGVVVLSNSGTGSGIDDIGMHLLNSKVPLLGGDALRPPKLRKETALDPSVLDRYTGRYRFHSTQMATVTREGNHLVFQPDGDIKIEYYPEDDQEFFAKITDSQIEIEMDARRNVTGLFVLRNGSTEWLRRIP